MILFHKNYKAADLVGKKVRLKDTIRNRGGIEIPTGAICEIIRAHHNLTIRFCCPHCGVKADISGIPRSADYIDLVLDEEADK